MMKSISPKQRRRSFRTGAATLVVSSGIILSGVVISPFTASAGQEDADRETARPEQMADMPRAPMVDMMTGDSSMMDSMPGTNDAPMGRMHGAMVSSSPEMAKMHAAMVSSSPEMAKMHAAMVSSGKGPNR